MERGGFKQENNRQSLHNYGTKNSDSKPQVYSETITPVFIYWINQIAKRGEKDDVFKLDGQIIDKVSIFGRIRKIEHESAKIKVTLDDGTDVITLTGNKKNEEGVPRALKNATLTLID